MFYLRCLLQCKAGYSFEDFHTIHNTLFATYHKAAIELGLFSNQNEAYFMLEDTVFSFQTPAQIRFLFARLIIEGYPARPLWDSFEEQLTIDHILAMPSAIRGQDNALHCIAELLQVGG